MNADWMPTANDLGPDPEPYSERFEILLAGTAERPPRATRRDERSRTEPALDFVLEPWPAGVDLSAPRIPALV